MQTQTAVIEKIRASYAQKKQTKLDELKSLDKRVKRPAQIFAYTYGSVSALVLVTGMCLAMEVIGSMMALGIVVGVLGIAMSLTTYPLFKKFLGRRKKKYSEKIFALSDEILNK